MVVNRFQQWECININEIFSHIVKLTTIRSVMSIVVVKNLHVE